MKKIIWEVFFVLSVVFCVFFGARTNSISAKAAVNGTLIDGKSFNLAIREMVWGKKVTKVSEPDYTVKKFIFTRNSSALPGKKMNSTSVGTNVTAYYDEDNKTVYIYTTAPRFIFNQDSSWMFAYYTVTRSIDFGKNQIDTSGMQLAVHMFSRMVNLDKIDVSEFNTSNVTEFTSMFYLCAGFTDLDLSNFNTSKATDISGLCYGCYDLQTVNLSSFNTSNVDRFFGVFYNCPSLTSLDLSNFTTNGKVKYTQCMFYNCSKLEYLNIRNMDITGAEVQEMFKNCKSLKRIVAPRGIDKTIDVSVKLVLDNDDDMVADTGDVFEALQVANKSNSYLALSEALSAAQKKNSGDLQAVVDSTGRLKAVGDGFIYHINADKTVSVSKITAKGKVKVGSVIIGGVTYPVTRIEAEACKGNTKIKSIEIGQSIVSIGKNAFSGCKNLKKVKIKANKALKVEKNAFKKINKKASIVVKGIKGKAKKKMVKAIKKQTNAKVR